MKSWENTERVLQQFVDEKTVSGCGLQIFQNGVKLFDACRGASSADGTRPMTADTRLRLHSMSKNYTCAGFMTLYEKGLFGLDDPVADYLPEFSSPLVCVSDTDISDVVPAKSPVTIRQLLSMQSGLTYWTFPGLPDLGPVQKELKERVAAIAAEVRSGRKNTLEEFVKEVASLPLCFHPGEHWMYGLSLTVVGRLIEVLSGMTIGEYLKQALWEPLGLTRTCFIQQLTGEEELADLMVDATLAEMTGMTIPAEAYPEGRRDVFGCRDDFLPGTDLGVELPCGGMTSTMNDLSRLFAMFACGGELDGTRVLERETIDLMRTNQLDDRKLAEFAQETNKGFGYGLGYRVFRDAGEAGFSVPAGSFGWDGASGCYGLASPDTGMSFVFIEQSLPHHIAYTIPRIVNAMNKDMN